MPVRITSRILWFRQIPEERLIIPLLSRCVNAQEIATHDKPPPGIEREAEQLAIFFGSELSLQFARKSN
jgi:hypothetical protein